MKSPESLEQCHLEKQDTTMLKVPTRTELFLMQLELIVEKMSAKTESGLWKGYT